MAKSLFVVFWGLSALATAAAPGFPWPHGAKYAVSLTYDDSLASQRQVAIPALDKAGLKGTFYLSGAPYTDPAALALWKPAAKAGHELGSHSIKHPCFRPEKAPIDGTIESYDLATMDKELRATKKILAKVSPKGSETFAYPCGADFVGEAKTSYRPLVKTLFKSARNAWGGPADPRTIDLHGVTTVIGDRPSAELIADTEAAKGTGVWLVYLFHGVGGDYLSVTAQAHQELLDRLKADKDDVWVAPFGEVAAWVKGHRH